MSDILTGAVKALNDRLGGDALDGIARFDIEDTGSVWIGPGGASTEGPDPDVTLTASSETFQDLLAGAINPTAAFMTGKLRVEGNMGLAMKLGSLLG